jgi:hypothetical protein
MSGAWPFYDITDSHYIWGFTISWQNRLILFWGLTISWHNRLILCLGLDHFMTTQTDTMSQTYYQSVLAWNGQAPEIVSVGFVMKWWSPRNSISLFCHENWYYVWGLTISWQHRLILCLGLDHFMTKQTDTMSEIWLFHDKTDWYYVWGLSISSQNRLILCEMVKPQRLILCLRLDHFMTTQTDTMSGASPFHNKQTDTMSVLSWNSQAPDIVSVCFVMKYSNLRHNISLFWHEIVFHDKTDWYYVWDLTISWQNRLILCLGFDHFMTKKTDSCHEMVEPQT